MYGSLWVFKEEVSLSMDCVIEFIELDWVQHDEILLSFERIRGLLCGCSVFGIEVIKKGLRLKIGRREEIVLYGGILK